MTFWVYEEKWQNDLALDMECIATGARLRGHEVKRFTKTPELQQGDILYGLVSHIHELNLPLIEDYPEELFGFTFPKERMLLSEAKDNYEFPFWVKPYRHKEFTGMVAKSELSLRCVDGDPEVWVGNLVEIYSEWRVYILDREPLKACHYKGNCLEFPFSDTIQKMIETWTSQPRAYALDVGVTIEGTKLIEINDVFCLGNYGLESALFAQMLEARWQEIAS